MASCGLGPRSSSKSLSPRISNCVISRASRVEQSRFSFCRTQTGSSWNRTQQRLPRRCHRCSPATMLSWHLVSRSRRRPSALPPSPPLDLLNEPNRHRVAVEFSVAGLDGGDDDEDGVQDPEDGEENEADQDQTKDGGDDIVDEHRDLEVDGFFAVRVDLGRLVALDQPDNEGRQQVPWEMKKDAEQGAGMAERAPGADICNGVDVDGRRQLWV